MAAPIQPGDTLILMLDDKGGRIATVHEVTPDGSIIERHSIASQQQYVDARPRSRFVRPRDAAAAHEAIGRMKQIAETRDIAVHDAEATAKNAFRSVWLEYEVEHDLEDAD